MGTNNLVRPKKNSTTKNKAQLTLLVLTFLVHFDIRGGGHNVPTDIRTPTKPQVFVQIK